MGTKPAIKPPSSSPVLFLLIPCWESAAKPPLPRAQGVGIQCPLITRHLFRAGAVQSSLTKGVAIVCCSHLGFASQPCLQLRPDKELSSSINSSLTALLPSLRESSSSSSKTSRASKLGAKTCQQTLLHFKVSCIEEQHEMPLGKSSVGSRAGSWHCLVHALG